ncbi:ATP-dependent protease ATPase subunit HslU [Striga asiatica]|uniref:ATP-dependent protease ATPase subunit HslU n=1 Tax=Striga asiatica TaxID=4170 RepID=A0A5A7RJL1_STRAF|nr:ATP-dependent protease ATPase subunit HslU [Striga asiatica]
MGDLYALDFDGVLCDSCGESSLSAVKAAKVRWPNLFNGVDSSIEDWIVDQMHIIFVRPKVKVLKLLQEMPEHQGLSLHFVEDRLATLKNVINEPELNKWNLYLGDWGYNTQKEREEAASISRIQLLQLSSFSKKLK